MLKKVGISVFAAASVALTPMGFAITGVFVDGNAGYANQDTASTFDFRPYGGPYYNNRVEHRFAWDVAVGYNYDTNEQFGAGGEIGYADYNQVKYRNSAGDIIKNKQTAWLLLADGTWHVSPMFDVIAKAGIVYGQAIGSYAGVGEKTVRQTAHLYKPIASIGVGWNITPQVNVHANWDHIFGSRIHRDDIIDAVENCKKVDKFQTMDAFWLGLKYTFST